VYAILVLVLVIVISPVIILLIRSATSALQIFTKYV
jgi:hypothetical protein